MFIKSSRMFFQEVHLHTFAYNMGKYLESRLNLIFMTTFTTPTSNHIIATCVENFASQSQTTHGKPQEKKS
jgi:hypothetical protein